VHMKSEFVPALGSRRIKFNYTGAPAYLLPRIYYRHRFIVKLLQHRLSRNGASTRKRRQCRIEASGKRKSDDRADLRDDFDRPALARPTSIASALALPRGVSRLELGLQLACA